MYGGNRQDDVSLNGVSIQDDMTIQGNLGADSVDIGVPTSFPGGIAASTVRDRLVVQTGV